MFKIDRAGIKSCVFIFLCLVGFSVQAATLKPEQQLLLKQVQHGFQSGKKTQARQQLESAINKADVTQLSDRPFVYQAHFILATLHAKNGDYRAQLQVLEKLSALLESWQLGQTTDAVTVLQNIAQVSVQLGKEEEAISVYQKSLQLARKLYSANDLRISNILLSLAKAHTNRMQSEKSEAYFEEIEQALAGGKGKQFELMRARLVQARGELLFRQARTRQASELYRQALQQREQILGWEHLETAQTVSSLAGGVKGLD